ncbi:MAG: thiolase family protein [Thermoplasmatales archaeon]|nr:thiolase family protein [Candidatus Thermoplasmatota archaeon]MCL6002733.1 thiolase family protein [Candidatus Thermoplasmatota archaeon]MDA8054724.1 thiolase family protein [Thermoplasmatales archaeon]
MVEVFIVGGMRTPLGKYGKSLAGYSAIELGAAAIKGAIQNAGIQPSQVQEVVMGNVIEAGLGQDPARQAAIAAGIPVEVSGSTVNMVCASGMLAIANAYYQIRAGQRDVMIVGGMESMSNAPFLLDSSFRRENKGISASRPVMDSMIKDGLWDFKYNKHMGAISDDWAKNHNVTREMADEYALESFRRASEATKNGYFKNEIIPIKGFDIDEGIRETSMEMLASLKPSFSQDGVLTAGNSSQLTDGAAALVLANEDFVNQYSLEKRAKVIGFDTTSMDPADFPFSPVPSVKNLLKRVGMKIGDFDLIEHNEAFAVASVAVRNGLGVDWKKFNIRGGAIALGHPLGASGARIVLTLLRELEDLKLSRGLATICHGGGGAYSMAIEAI